MDRLVVYRVAFSGDGPTDVARDLESSEVWWEGSESGVGPSRHWALIRARSPEEAAGLVRDAVAPHGDFSAFTAEPVRDSKGAVWRDGFHRNWEEIDWEVPALAALGELARAAMYALADAAEPTELVRREVGRPRAAVESALRELCDKGLVEQLTGPFFDADYDNQDEDWWRLTHAAWDLLGFIRPVLYH